MKTPEQVVAKARDELDTFYHRFHDLITDLEEDVETLHNWAKVQPMDTHLYVEWMREEGPVVWLTVRTDGSPVRLAADIVTRIEALGFEEKGHSPRPDGLIFTMSRTHETEVRVKLFIARATQDE